MMRLSDDPSSRRSVWIRPPACRRWSSIWRRSRNTAGRAGRSTRCWRCCCWSAWRRCAGGARSRRSPTGGRGTGSSGCGTSGSRATVRRASRPSAASSRGIAHKTAEAAVQQWAQHALRLCPPAAGALEGVALDGKTLRGSKRRGAADAHLLAAFSHRLGVVLGQVGVPDKTNAIGAADEFARRDAGGARGHGRRAADPAHDRADDPRQRGRLPPRGEGEPADLARRYRRRLRPRRRRHRPGRRPAR